MLLYLAAVAATAAGACRLPIDEGGAPQGKNAVSVISETVGGGPLAGLDGKMVGEGKAKRPGSRIIPLCDVPLEDGFQAWLYTTCEEWGVDYPMVVAMAEQESTFRTDAIGEQGEVGMWQVMPSTAREAEEALGRALDLSDPYDCGEAAVFLMAKYQGKYGDNIKALIAYSMGEAGAQERFEEGNPRSMYAVSVLEKAEGYGRRPYREGRTDG